nr:CPBP family glutamic-type intramembrane protease [Microbacterium ulmi]
MLALALFSVGAGMLAGILIATLWPSPWAQAAATALLWVGMLVPVVRGLSLSRPAGLLRIRPLDVLFGVALGGMLRLVQGWIESAAGGSGALPSYPLIDGGLDSAWWLTAAVAPVVVAPVVEELFFRGVVLVSVFTALRRPLGSAGAGLAAVLASTVLFVVVHASDGTASVDQVVSAGLVGLVSALLVTLTGRLGGAVLVHVVYNASFLALAVAGTFWA